MGAPTTLPGDFFDDQAKAPPAAHAPQVLPGNFFDSKAEVPPFPVDEWHEDQIKHLPPEKQVEQRNNFTSVMYELAKPWLDAGYSGAAAMNRGLANFATEWEQTYKGFERATGQRPEGEKPQGGFKGLFSNVHTPTDTAIENFFGKAAQEFNANADYWQEQMAKEGVGAIDKLFRFVGGSTGAAVPGAAQFMTEWGSKLAIPLMSGYEASSEAHEVDPVAAGLQKAAETGTMATLFAAVAPLRRWLQASILGTAFGAQEALHAPPGQRLEAMGKGYATAGLLSMVTPSGKYGLKDVYKEIAGAAPKASGEPTEIVDTRLRPAIKDKNGKVIAGMPGETHPDIVERATGEPPVSLDELNADPALADKVLSNPEGNLQPVIDRAVELKKEEAPRTERPFVIDPVTGKKVYTLEKINRVGNEKPSETANAPSTQGEIPTSVIDEWVKLSEEHKDIYDREISGEFKGKAKEAMQRRNSIIGRMADLAQKYDFQELQDAALSRVKGTPSAKVLAQSPLNTAVLSEVENPGSWVLPKYRGTSQAKPEQILLFAVEKGANGSHRSCDG